MTTPSPLPQTPASVLERIAGVILTHYPDGEACTCGEPLTDPKTWAAHTAAALDEDGRKWASEQQFG